MYAKYAVEVTATVAQSEGQWYWEVGTPMKCLTNGFEPTEDAAEGAVQDYLKRLQAVVIEPPAGRKRR